MPVAVGIIAGLFAGNVRLHLGLSGHKVVFWLMPVIVVRLLGGCKVGSTAGSLSAAFTSLGLGGNLAGSLLGLPLVGFAGATLDVVINSMENKQTPYLLLVPIVGIASMFANQLCFIKRALLPAGPNPNFIFGMSGLWFDLVCYSFFGLTAGLMAATLAWLINRQRMHREK